jgi:hypothetical protein
MHPHALRHLTRLTLISAIALLTACTSPLQRAENQAELQRLNTPMEVPVTAPPFNEAQARQALARGNTTIKGALYFKLVNGGKNAGSDAGLLSFQAPTPVANARVVLYPASAQLEEIMRLSEENDKERRWGRKAQLKTFVGEPQLYHYALQTKTDEHGLFEFNGMRPGRYLIAAETWEVTSNGSETQFDGVSIQPTGAIVSAYGVAPVYSQVIHSSQHHFRVKTVVVFEQFIDVPPKQKVFEVDARMRPR